MTKCLRESAYEEGRFILAYGFRSFSPRSLNPIALDLWQGRKEREDVGGSRAQYDIQGHAPNDLFSPGRHTTSQ
jgi:hypothetical protein